MTGTPDAAARHPGPIKLVIAALFVVLFSVKLALWYHAVSSGAAATSAMTGWSWFRIGFYHVAVLAGIAGFIGMLRERGRVKSPDSTQADVPAAMPPGEAESHRPG